MATVVIPNTFVAGNTARASEVNANFTAITDQVNGNLSADNLANAAVTENKIGTAAVTNVKVASGIDAVKIGDGLVSNTEFGYLDGVTSAIQTQLGAAVTTAKIEDGAVTTAKLDEQSVTGAKLAATITTNHTFSGTLTFSGTVVLPVI